MMRNLPFVTLKKEEFLDGVKIISSSDVTIDSVQGVVTIKSEN